MRRLAGLLVIAGAVLVGCFGPFAPDPGDGEANNPPTVELSAQTTVYLGDSVELLLIAEDPEGDPLEWSFEIDSRPDDSNVDAIEMSGATASFTPDTLGEYVIRVSVTDGTNEAFEKITISAVSGEPAIPGEPQPTDDSSNIGIARGLDWADSPGATSYEVYLGTPSLPDVPTATVSESFYAPASALSYSTSYFWRIVAVNSYGTTDGPEWSFTTQDEPLSPPAVPSNPNPADDANEELPNLTLDWDNSEYATSHDVYLRTGRASFSRVAQNLPSSSYSPSGLDYGRSYEWYVVAKNAEKSTTGPTWSFATQSLDLASQLGGYWTFDGVLGDSSGFGHHGTWYPQLAYTHFVPGSSPVYVTNRHGSARSAVALTSTYSQYVRIPMEQHTNGPLNNHSQGFSLSFWFYDSGENDFARLISKRYPSNLGYEFDLASGDRARWVRHGSVASTIYESEMVSGWNHVAISWDFSPARLRVWMNGDLTEDYAATPFEDSIDDLYFGRNGPGNYFTGYLDDVRIYYRPISPIEVDALFGE